METKKTEPCPLCNGQGVKVTRSNHFSVSSTRPCYRCMGEGTIPSVVGETLSIEVLSGDDVKKITVMLHKAWSEEELLQPQELYKNRPPLYPHFEVEVLSFDHALASVVKLSKSNDRTFMFWLGNLSTQDKAMEVLELWALGTVWSAAKKKDFLELLQEVGGGYDYDALTEILSHEGIKIANAKELLEKQYTLSGWSLTRARKKQYTSSF